MRKTSILKLQKVVYGLSLVILTACGQVSPATPMPTLTTTPTVFPTSTATPIPTNTPEATPTPAVEQFPKLDIDHWSDCDITPEDLLAYADWAKEQLLAQRLTIPEPDRTKAVIFFGAQYLSFFYAGPKFEEIPVADRPYLVGPWFCKAEFDRIFPDGQESHWPYIVTTVAFSIPGKPGEFVVVPVIMWGKAYNESDDEFYARLHSLVDFGKLPLRAGGGRIKIIQREEINEANVPDIADRIKKFYETFDPTYIDGIIFEVSP